MKAKVKKNKLKQKQDELKNFLKKAKRPANKRFFEECLADVKELLTTRVGSAKPFGIAKKF